MVFLPRKECAGQCPALRKLSDRCGFLLCKHCVHFCRDFESVCYVEDVSLAPRPSAIGVEIDGAALVDESPAYDMRLLTVTAGGETLGVAGRGTGLANLVHVTHELQDFAAFTGDINERFAAAERSFRFVEEAQDQNFGVIHVRLTVLLLLGPAGAGDEEKFGVRADGLSVRLRRFDMFNLMWLSLPQSKPHEKVTVTIKTTDGQVIQ